MEKILLIEKSAFFRLLIADFLTIEGFDVTTATDGLQGIRLAQAIQPALILCHVNLPDRDGHDVLQQVRENALTAQIPFVFLTAEFYLSDHCLATQLKHCGYLTKTLAGMTVLKLMVNHFKNIAVLEKTLWIG